MREKKMNFKLSDRRKIAGYQKVIFGVLFMGILQSNIFAADTMAEKQIIRSYRNPSLGVLDFKFSADKSCALTLTFPTDAPDVTQLCTWAQVGKANRIIVNWENKEFAKSQSKDGEDDVYFLLHNKAANGKGEHCLVRKSIEYTQKAQKSYDVFELSKGVPLCIPD